MFTQQQKNIIDGLLLGDGSLSKLGKAKNACLVVQRAQKDIEYLKYHSRIFKNYLTPIGVKVFTVFDKRTNKYYDTSYIKLKACEELEALYQKWYPNNKKIVPKDLELSSEAIATWICDDGHVRKTQNGYYKIKLATHSFTFEEVDFLRDQLLNKYNVKTTTALAAKNQKVINIADFAIRNLVEHIDPVFPEGMERKRLWVSGFNSKVFFSKKDSVKEKINQVEEFIKNNGEKEFTALDVSKYFNWTCNDKVYGKQYDRTTAKLHINKFVLAGVLGQKLIKDKNPKSGFIYFKIK